MKKKIFLTVIVLLFVASNINAQPWKGSPSSIIYGNGTNHFLGELGGGKKQAAHFFGIRDIDIQATRPTWMIGYRYRFHEYFTVRANFAYAMISGDDASSGSLDRKARNLSFRSNIFELSAQVEYYFVKEKGVAKSSFGSLKGFSPFAAYVFVGFGALYYNPKAKHPETGKWIELRPLGTEGQFANSDGSPYTYKNRKGEVFATPKPYKRVAALISMGLGMKYDLNKQWAIGLEVSNRYTTSDYIDDTHDKYFKYEEFGLTPPSEYTNVFADRSYRINYSVEGDILEVTDEAGNKPSGHPRRGDPNFNDAYLFAMVTVYYKLSKTRISRPKFN